MTILGIFPGKVPISLALKKKLQKNDIEYEKVLNLEPFKTMIGYTILQNWRIKIDLLVTRLNTPKFLFCFIWQID